VSFFDRFRSGDPPPPPPVKDPVFGEIDPTDDGGWDSLTFFEPVKDDVIVTGPEAMPTGRQRQLFLELKDRYAALQAAIGRCLFELYRPHLASAAERNQPAPRTPEEMLTLTVLNSVEFGAHDEMRLGYGFRGDEDVDGPVFTVRILGWQPTGESVDMDDAEA